MHHNTQHPPTDRLPTGLRGGLCLCLWLLLIAGPARANLEPEQAEPEPERTVEVVVSEQEKAYRNAIDSIEAVHGAYGPGLSEQIFSLGTTLQNQGRHEEAVELFKRGVHLARINDGLYSTQQLPLLQGQVASHIALGQYAEADERQHYMYRVQQRTMDNSEVRTQALMQQASWQYNAYHLGLGEAGFLRLMAMWDLYRMALTDTMDREGEDSPDLLPPLQGMLKTQYLIAAYQPEEAYSGADDLGARQQLHRFNAYRSQSYQRGASVIMAIYDIEQKQEQALLADTATAAPEAEAEAEAEAEINTESEPESEPDSIAETDTQTEQASAAEAATEPSAESKQPPPGLASARALVMLGDWRLWHEEKDEAYQAYSKAIAELVQRDDAQLQIDRIFADPVALPNLEGMHPLPPPATSAENNILLEFGVTKKGRVVDLERIDENEVNASRANRLMRKLRRTKFRPRLEAGEPVDTEKVVRAYGIE